MKGVRTLVVGDVMLDRFVRGGVSRISPEAPVPVVEVERVSEHPGGAANVAKNLIEYTDTVAILGKVAPDASGRALERILAEQNIDTSYLVSIPDGETSTKTRVVAGHQQVVRFDQERTNALTPDEEKMVLEALSRAENNFDCIIVEDYAKGFLTESVINRLREFAAAGVVVSVDPNPRHLYKWSGFTAVKPNLHEACAATGLSVKLGKDAEPSTHDGIRDLVHKLTESGGPEHLLVTVGEHGMIYAGRDGELHHLPAKAREVFDVSGAGDTAIAVFSLALGAGLGGRDAAYWANEAASLVVGKLGTATVPLSELVEAATEKN